MVDGWYGIVRDGDSWRPVTPCENRHAIALADAIDSEEATHVGYWTGEVWENIEALEGEDA
jgi:hypothetical protein